MKTVVFVCLHNSGRSMMAEAFFNHIAKGRAKALYAGTQPGDRGNPTVLDAMKEVVRRGISKSGGPSSFLVRRRSLFI